METISFRCTKCKFALKVGADKAGRTAKCSKCGTLLTIPGKNGAEQAPPPPPPAPPKPKPKNDDDDEEGGMTFEMKDLGDLADERRQQEQASKTTVQKGPGRQMAKKKAKITDPIEWRKVGLASRVIAGGLCVWLASYVLFHVPLILGMTQRPEMAVAADSRLVVSSQDSTKGLEIDLWAFTVNIIAGSAFADAMRAVFICAAVLSLLQIGPLLAGYAMCLVVPDRFGTRLQIKVLLGLTFLNAVFLVVFKLLPMLGVLRYVNLPFMAPQVVMLEMNAERSESLLMFWLRWPLLESYCSILMTFLLFLEPALIATFLHAVGKSIKSDDMEGSGLIAMKLAFAQIFIQVAWLMASLCGTTVVLLWSLRATYVLGFGFFVGQLAYTIYLLFMVSPVVEEQLGDEADLPATGAEDDDDEDDEEEEDE